MWFYIHKMLEWLFSHHCSLIRQIFNGVNCTLKFMFTTVLLLGSIYYCATMSSELTGDPNFSAPISNVSVTIGREGILTCNVYDLNSYKVAWLRVDTQTILTIQHHIITKNQRIGMSSVENRIWQLRIKNVRPDDRGWYMCQLNTDPMKSQMGYLNVVAPPDILDQQTSQDIVVQEGQNINLTCVAIGSPEPTIRWRKETHRALLSIENQTKSVLFIKHANRRHTGAYLCIASNGIPPSVSKRITVVVHFSPIITIKQQILFVPIGQKVTLECITESYPNSVNYWLHDQDIIQDGIYETITLNFVYKVKMKLTITIDDSSDYGIYRCISKNIIGSSEKIVHVCQKTLNGNGLSVDVLNEIENGFIGLNEVLSSKGIGLQKNINIVLILIYCEYYLMQ